MMRHDPHERCYHYRVELRAKLRKERWGGWHGARVANPGSKKEECEIKPRVTPTARKKEEQFWGTYQGNRVNSRLSLALQYLRLAACIGNCAFDLC